MPFLPNGYDDQSVVESLTSTPWVHVHVDETACQRRQFTFRHDGACFQRGEQDLIWGFSSRVNLGVIESGCVRLKGRMRGAVVTVGFRYTQHNMLSRIDDYPEHHFFLCLLYLNVPP